MGANRFRLIRQFRPKASVIACVGAVGFLFMVWILKVLLAFKPQSIFHRS